MSREWGEKTEGGVGWGAPLGAGGGEAPSNGSGGRVPPSVPNLSPGGLSQASWMFSSRDVLLSRMIPG